MNSLNQGLCMPSLDRVWSLLFCFLFLFSYNEAGTRSAPRGGDAVGGAVFNVMSFGAKPGKNDDNSEAFIRAWRAACHSNEKAMLLIPPGIYQLSETIFQGPCQNHVTILVQGTIQAVSDLSAYTGTGWISIEDIDGLLITGGGTFDAQGQSMWKYNDCNKNSDCVHLPPSIYMEKANRTNIRRIKLINAMGFHMHITRCEDVRLKRLSITAPGDSPNTDGIHISKSNMIKVSRSIFRTGDDCVSIGQGSTNVTINQITCGPGHGISIGSLGKLPNELDVKGLIVKNCTLVGTTNGLRIKTYPASGPSAASGILFQDIRFDNVKNPIIINQNYGSKSTEPSRVKISNVAFRDIRGTTQSEVAVNLNCSSKVPCNNVNLHNINLRSNGKGAPKAICANVKVGYTGNQNPSPCK